MEQEVHSSPSYRGSLGAALRVGSSGRLSVGTPRVVRIDGGEHRRCEFPAEEETVVLFVVHQGSITVTASGRGHHLESSQWRLFDGNVSSEVQAGANARGLGLRYERGLLDEQDRATGGAVLECLCCPKRTESRLASGRLDGRLRSCLLFFSETEEDTVPERLLLQAKRLEALSIVLSLAETGKCPRKPACCTANICCLRRAACLLEQNLTEPHSLRRLCLAVGTNEFYLKRGFRGLFQTTVFGYLREKRMEHARALFERGKRNVTEVATEVGYTNISHFAAAFRRQFGMNPKVFVQNLDA